VNIFDVYIIFLNIRQNLYDISRTYFREYKIQERFQNVVCTSEYRSIRNFRFLSHLSCFYLLYIKFWLVEVQSWAWSFCVLTYIYKYILCRTSNKIYI